MSQDPFATSRPASSPAGTPAPWSLGATIAWSVAGLFAWGAAQFVVIAIYMATYRKAGDAAAVEALGTNGFLIAIVTIVASPAWIAVMVLASRRRGWHAADYLALVVPTRGQLVFGLVCTLPLLAAFDVLTYATGRDVVPPFMSESYKSAASSGSLLLFLIAMVFIAPVAEEIVFRGFLFRGLRASFLGVAGTLVVTSVAWALMHVQYDWAGIVQIFLIGLLLGWLRWASGSTLLTIVLHVMANFIALVETAIWVEWLG